MFCTCVAWVCFVCLLLCKEEGSSPAITERRDMDLYEVPLSMSLLGFGMGSMLANFHMCGIMLLLTLSLRNYFLGLTEFKYVIFNYVLVILLSFSHYFR